MIPEIASCALGMQKLVVFPSSAYVTEPPGLGVPSADAPGLVRSLPPPHAATISATAVTNAENVSLRDRMPCMSTFASPACSDSRLDLRTLCPVSGRIGDHIPGLVSRSSVLGQRVGACATGPG